MPLPETIGTSGQSMGMSRVGLRRGVNGYLRETHIIVQLHRFEITHCIEEHNL